MMMRLLTRIITAIQVKHGVKVKREAGAEVLA